MRTHGGLRLIVAKLPELLRTAASSLLPAARLAGALWIETTHFCQAPRFSTVNEENVRRAMPAGGLRPNCLRRTRRGGLQPTLRSCRSCCERLDCGILYLSGVGAWTHHDATDSTCNIFGGPGRACSHRLYSYAEAEKKKATNGNLAANGAGGTSTRLIRSRGRKGW